MVILKGFFVLFVLRIIKLHIKYFNSSTFRMPSPMGEMMMGGYPMSMPMQMPMYKEKEMQASMMSGNRKYGMF